MSNSNKWILIKHGLGCLLLMQMIGCQKSAKASSDAPATTATSSTLALAGLGTLSGTLALEENGAGQPAANAAVTVAGHPEYSAQTDANGAFTIRDMLPGSLTIYAQGSCGTSLDLPGSRCARAAQFKNVVVVAGAETKLPTDTVLTMPGSISGQVGLINNPQNATVVGITVYVPGTDFSAKTDESGVFTLANIPAGSYDELRCDQAGLTNYVMNDVMVASGQNTEVGSIYMSLSTGLSGQIAGISGTTAVTLGGKPKRVLHSATVTVNLKYDRRAVLMKIAHESSFINVNWIPVAATFTFTAANNYSATTNFATNGPKSVFVKFADENGLESSVYELDFIIDAQVPTLSSFPNREGRDQSYSGSTTINASSNDADGSRTGNPINAGVTDSSPHTQGP